MTASGSDQPFRCRPGCSCFMPMRTLPSSCKTSSTYLCWAPRRRPRWLVSLTRAAHHRGAERLRDRPVGSDCSPPPGRRWLTFSSTAAPSRARGPRARTGARRSTSSSRLGASRRRQVLELPLPQRPPRSPRSHLSYEIGLGTARMPHLRAFERLRAGRLNGPSAESRMRTFPVWAPTARDGRGRPVARRVGRGGNETGSAQGEPSTSARSLPECPGRSGRIPWADSRHHDNGSTPGSSWADVGETLRATVRSWRASSLAAALAISGSSG